MPERVGFGAHKLRLDPSSRRDQWERRNREMLSRVLNMRTTVAFIGSGLSAALGYPTWGQFARLVVGNTINTLLSLPAGDAARADLERMERFARLLDDPQAAPTDNLLFMLGACQRIMDLHGQRERYFASLQELFRAPRDP